jgi:hypothetical protein
LDTWRVLSPGQIIQVSVVAKNVPKPDFAHVGKAATLLEKISILDHVSVYLGAHWFEFLYFLLSLVL